MLLAVSSLAGAHSLAGVRHGSRKFLGCRAALAPAAQHSRMGRRRLQVQNNELNKWADRGGMDDDAGQPDDGFDRDTASVVLRVLTARATQKLLMQLQELDLFVAQWLNNYCSEHPPMDGNKFVSNLMKTGGTVIKDHTTGAMHTIDPQNLAHRILQIRSDLALAVTQGFTEFVAIENTGVMRSHLEAFTYTTSGFEDNNGRRGYRRPPRQQRPGPPGTSTRRR